ncbi:MAG: hypothetical protein ACN2B6_06850 [Rickettsiales bacterium]
MKHVLLALGILLAAPVALAQESTVDEKIVALETKLDALKKELDALKQERAGNTSAAEEKTMPAEIVAEAPPMPAPVDASLATPPVEATPIVTMPEEERQKILTDLQARYRICAYRYVAKDAGESQVVMEIANMQGTFGEREKLYRKYMATYPGSPNLQTSYVQEMLGEHMLKEAHYYLTDATKRFPDDPKVRFLLDQYRYLLAGEGRDKKLLKENLLKAFRDYDDAMRACAKVN